MTNNGLLDITVADAWYLPHDPERKRDSARIVLLENDGAGQFNERVIGDNIIGDSKSALVERHEHIDLTGNGYQDIVFGLLEQHKVMWLENPGPNSSKLWKQHFLADVYAPVEIKAAKIDDDIKIFVSSYQKGGLWLLEKTKKGWKKSTLASKGFGDTRMLQPVKSETGSKFDVVTASLTKGKIFVFSMDDKGNWDKKTIAKGFERPFYGVVHDMTGNDAIDIIVPSKELVWLENPTWTKNILAPSCGERLSWADVKIADLDGDGVDDFVAALRPYGNEGNGSVVMGLRRGSGYKLFKLIDNWGTPNQIEVADLNGNGRLDVIASTDLPINEVRVWREPGFKDLGSNLS